MGSGSTFTTLGDHADQVAFYGEIYDSNETPGKTKTDMGSGYWPEYGWTWSAYQRNLLVQTDRGRDDGRLRRRRRLGKRPLNLPLRNCLTMQFLESGGGGVASTMRVRATVN
jgi:hypothetical protein